LLKGVDEKKERRVQKGGGIYYDPLTGENQNMLLNGLTFKRKKLSKKRTR